MSALLNDRQIDGRANRPNTHLGYAQTVAGCIEAELGTPCAGDMVESAIGFAIQALADLEVIQTQLCLRRAIDAKRKGGAS